MQWTADDHLATIERTSFVTLTAADPPACPAGTGHSGASKTRKPSLEVAATTLATFLSGRKFSAGCYLFTNI